MPFAASPGSEPARYSIRGPGQALSNRLEESEISRLPQEFQPSSEREEGIIQSFFRHGSERKPRIKQTLYLSLRCICLFRSDPCPKAPAFPALCNGRKKTELLRGFLGIGDQHVVAAGFGAALGGRGEDIDVAGVALTVDAASIPGITAVTGCARKPHSRNRPSRN